MRSQEKTIPVFLWQVHGIIIPELQYQFHRTRRWRFDYAWPGQQVAVEINGGTWIYGRHNRAKTYIKDLEKINAAQELNWIILQYIPDKVDFNQIKRVVFKRKLFITRMDFEEEDLT